MRPAVIAKQKIVNNIHEQINNANQTIVIKYQGLTVAQLSELRIKLKSKGASLKIYKNNLFDLALKNTPYTNLSQELVGPNAFVFGTKKELNLARFLNEYALAIKEKKIEVRAGVFENQVFLSKNIENLTKLRTKTELLTALAFALK